MCRYQSYEQIDRIGEKYYKDDNYCGVVAVTVASGCSFGKAYNICKKLGRKDRKGTPMWISIAAMKKLGYKVERMPIRPCKTLMMAERKLPKTGTYWLLTRDHIACLKDGRLMDWSRKSKKQVYCVYKVETA